MDELKVKRIHFEKETWHPLDHRIGDSRCVTFQADSWSAVRVHASYWWRYKRHSDLAWLYRLLFCWWGGHLMVTWHDRNRRINAACEWCEYQTGWAARRE